MKTLMKNTLILFAITLVAGFGLGFVYNITQSARAQQEEKTKIEAYESVMPGMDSFEKISIDYTEVQKFIKNKVTDYEQENNISVMKPIDTEINEVVLAKDSEEKELGYIVTVTDKEAYDGTLQMTVGVRTDGTVLGISFLSLSETPGLGMKAGEDEFRSQFANKKADYFVYSKNGAKAENEINAISSATITTNAVVHGVNSAVCCVKYLTGGDR